MRLSQPTPKKPRTISASKDDMGVGRGVSRPIAAAARPPADNNGLPPLISHLDDLCLTLHANGVGVNPLPISWALKL